MILKNFQSNMAQSNANMPEITSVREACNINGQNFNSDLYLQRLLKVSRQKLTVNFSQFTIINHKYFFE